MANVVTVTGTFYTASASGVVQPAAGNITFTPSDLLWDTTGVYVGMIEPVGESFNQSGAIAPIPLLAMDNAGFSGNWCWLVTIESGGTTYPTRKLLVNFSNGATQDISVLLATSTLA